MSTTTELAEAEARRIEDEERAAAAAAAGEGDTPAEAESAPAASGEPTKRQLRELDSEQERHHAEVNRIMGEFVEGFEACEECSGVGLVPPGPKPRTHEWYKACPTCAGFGLVVTGSLSPGNESTACPDCGGRGFLEAIDASGTSLAELRRQGVAPSSAPAGEHLENGGNGNSEHREGELVAAGFGRPSWMGDPSLGTG